MESVIRNLSMRVAGQMRRDISCVCTLIITISVFLHYLATYLSALRQPQIFAAGFVGSMLITFIYDVSKNSMRFTFIRATRSATLFAIGIVVAGFLREIYLHLCDQIVHVPEVRLYVGEEFYGAVTNQAIGYGGCFAIAMGLMRLMLGHAVERILTKIFVAPELMPSACPHCSQLMHR